MFNLHYRIVYGPGLLSPSAGPGLPNNDKQSLTHMTNIISWTPFPRSQKEFIEHDELRGLRYVFDFEAHWGPRRDTEPSGSDPCR
jgi:hypothetical protein